MMRAVLILALGLAAAGAGFSSSSEKPGAGEGEGSHLELWKWANFLVLAGGIGYLVKKNAGPFFDSRSKKISQSMTEAAALRKDAEARAAEVDRRLANLQVDIAVLREESRKEAEAQTQRVQQQALADIARVETTAQQEIEAAGKAARLELKRYTGELALSLAEHKIRERMTPETQDTLVRNFVRGLAAPGSKAQTN
jgi:F-type H+-transporting ATPase subunit b